jgi:hypothetical protein
MIGAVAMISVLRPSLPQKQLDRAETITDVLDADCGLLAGWINRAPIAPTQRDPP